MIEQSAIPTVETQRLALRGLDEEDASPLARLMDADVSRWLASWPALCSTEEALKKIRRLRTAARRRQALPLAITDRRTQVIMGMMAFSASDLDSSRAEMSYWLGRGFHGAGYMREALSAALPIAFDFLGAATIEGGGQPGNESSFAVMRALGFSRIEDRSVYAPSRSREELCHYYELRKKPAQDCGR